MKKIIMILIVFTSFLLIGCNFVITTSTTSSTSDTTTSSDSDTTTSQTTTTTSSSNTTTTTSSSNTTTSTTSSSTITTTTTTTTTTVPDEILMIIIEGQDTVEINTNWIDRGANCSVNGTVYSAITSDEVDSSTLGIYEIEYEYIYNEETYSIIRYVIVVDQISPVLTLNLGIDTIIIGGTWMDGGANVYDNSLEQITISVTGSINTSIAGTYQIVYTAEDSSGNVSSIVRYVTVIE